MRQLHKDTGSNTEGIAAATKELEDLRSRISRWVKREQESWVSDAAQLVCRCEVLCLEAMPGPASLGAEDKERLLRGLESCRETLGTMAGVGMHPFVNARFFRAASVFHREFGPPAEFYGNGLNFLAYMDLKTMPKDEKVAWGVDLALSALIGDKIFSFGKVLENNIMQELAGTPHAWLRDLLTAFHRGDVAAFNACVAKVRLG